MAKQRKQVEPKVGRPRMPGYGIPETKKGLLPWKWAEQRLRRVRTTGSQPSSRTGLLTSWWCGDCGWMELFCSAREASRARHGIWRKIRDAW